MLKGTFLRKQKTIILYSMIATLLLFYISFNFYIQDVKKSEISFLEDMIKREAITVFETVASTRQWVANHNGVYVYKDNGTDNQEKVTQEHPMFEKLSPDMVTKEIADISINNTQHRYSLISSNPINADNYPNKFEKRALDFFEHNKKQSYYFERDKNFQHFNFVGVLIANQSCLSCHSQNNLGDVLGGISIQLPLKDYQKKYNDVISGYQNIFIWSLIFVLIAVLIISYLIHQFFTKKEQLEQNNDHLLKLKDSNEMLIRRYKYAVEGSQNGIWDWDLQTDEVYFDKNWKSMLGYEEDELPSQLQEWDKRVHPDDKEHAMQSILDNQQKVTDFYNSIHRLQHKDGHWVWILDQGKTYFDAKGKAIRMVGFHTDITELKELEYRLYEKEQNLMTAQEVAHMGHWRYDIVNDIFVVSNALYKLLNIPQSKKFYSYSDFIEYIHEDDVDYYLNEHQKIFFDKSKSSLQYRMYKHKSDEVIYIHEHISYLYNSSADVESYFGTMQDISALKTAERDLGLFKKIIDNSPISIIITDVHANIIYVNKFFLKLTKYKYEEVIGQNPRILKSDNTSKEEYQEMWATLMAKKTWGGIFKNINKEGEEYWETALIIPIMDERGEIVNFFSVKREITKEIYLEKELKNKEEMMLLQSKHAAMGEMISMIAHQWRQPITTISMIANNMLAEIELEIFDEKSAKQFALELSDQTQYLSKTIDDFRNFFKEDKHTEEVVLKEFFDDVLTIISASLKNNNIELVLEYEENIEFKTYVRELLQVMINIIKNAKEAFEHQEVENKQIRVVVTLEDNKLVFTITDNAGGIEEKYLQNIFEPYFTTKEEHNGTGLGLYMSKMIVQKHLKGNIMVKNVDKGASFTVCLEQFLE